MSLNDLLTADETELAEHYPTPAERHADGLVHAVGIVCALIGSGLLFAYALTKDGVHLATAVALYAVCLVIMLACSALYNLTRPSPARRLLRRLDEGAIFLMIAGSYTPFVVQLWPAYWDWAAAGLMWIAALAGVAGKIALPQMSDRAWCFIYLAFGWLGALLLGPGIAKLPMIVLALITLCGLVYSGGVLVYLNHKLPFRRAVWHALVVLAAGLHYGAVYLTVSA